MTQDRKATKGLLNIVKNSFVHIYLAKCVNVVRLTVMTCLRHQPFATLEVLSIVLINHVLESIMSRVFDSAINEIRLHNYAYICGDFLS